MACGHGNGRNFKPVHKRGQFVRNNALNITGALGGNVRRSFRRVELVTLGKNHGIVGVGNGLNRLRIRRQICGVVGKVHGFHFNFVVSLGIFFNNVCEKHHIFCGLTVIQHHNFCVIRHAVNNFFCFVGQLIDFIPSQAHFQRDFAVKRH